MPHMLLYFVFFQEFVAKNMAIKKIRLLGGRMGMGLELELHPFLVSSREF